MMRPARGLDLVQPVLVLAGRTLLGILLSVSLGVLGVGLAWSLFVFSGATSQTTLLSMFMIGCAVGSSLGAMMAWMRIDRHPPKTALFGAFALVVLISVAGAWVGFRFGATREVECCVGPAIEPITYLVGGTALFTNITVIVMAIGYDLKGKGGWGGARRTSRNAALGPPGSASGLPG